MAFDWLTALKGFSSLASAAGQYTAANGRARVDELNAGISDMQARDAVARGAQEAVQRGRQTDQQIGAQRSAIANNNLQLSGTALDLIGQTADIGAQDETTIRNNAARQAWGYWVQAASDRYSADVARSNGATAAIGSLATGLVDTADFRRKALESIRTKPITTSPLFKKAPRGTIPTGGLV